MSLSQRKIIKNLFAKLQKKYKTGPVLPDEKREFLDLLIFAALMENTSVDIAYSAFDLAQNYFVDWNEMRVAATRELAELFPNIQNPKKQGERTRRVLQWIFELQYNFDMQKVQGQNAETVLPFLTSIPYSTHFMNDLVMYILFSGRPIPFDEGAMRVLRLLECVDVNNDNKEIPVGFDFLKSKNEKLTFFLLLHELGADLMREETEPDVRKFLKSIDPEAEFRSWIPLVECNETDDPLLIAKQVIKKERKRHLPPIVIEADIDLEDNFDPNPLTEEVDYVSETDDIVGEEITETVYSDSNLDSDETNLDPMPKNPKKGKSDQKVRAKKQSEKEKEKTLSSKTNGKDQRTKIEEKNPPPLKNSKKEKKDTIPSSLKEQKNKKSDLSASQTNVKTVKKTPKKETVKKTPKKNSIESKGPKKQATDKAKKESLQKNTSKKSVKTSAKISTKVPEKKKRKEEAESEVKKLQKKKPR